jgi:hypothetical protein
MAESIRGLTVEISADASSFNKEMSSMRKAAQQSQTELNALQKSLELEFDSDKFARAQKVAQNAIDQTAANADALRRRLDYLENAGNIDTDQYRKLKAELAKTELQAQQLEKQLEKINQIKFDAISSRVTKVGDAISNVGKTLAPFSAAATLGIKTAATGAELDDLSLRLGISAEKIQEYQYVTAQAGVEWDTFEKALIKARAAIVDLSAGTINNASKALQSLGLRVEDFDSKEAMFDGIIDALSNMEDKTLQTAYANEIFGDNIANQMLPYLNAGTDAINQFKSEFETIGALSNEQVAALAKLDDTIYLLKESLKNVCLQIGASFAPLLQRVAEIINTSLIPKLQKLAEWFNSLTIEQQAFAAKVLLVVAALAPLALGIGKVVSAIGGIIKLIPALQAGLSALAANQIILIIAVIAAILLLLNNLVSTLGEALQPALDAVMQVLDLVMQVLQPIIDLVGGVLAVAINIISEALQPVIGIIQAIFDIISPLLDMLMSVVEMILTPIQVAIQALFGILQPLLSVALIPLKVVLQALQVPLQMLGTLLGWLAPIFKIFGNVVTKIFSGVVKIINIVVGVVEDAVNFVIGIINKLIDGVNSSLGWLGVHIDRIAEVKLRIDTSEIKDMDDVNAIIDSTAPTQPKDNGGNGGTVYDNGNSTGTSGDIYNYDNSTKNTTQNITVTIQNYAAEVDTDKLVREINMKLAEAM